MDFKPFNDIGTIAILSEGVYTPKEAKRIYPLEDAEHARPAGEDAPGRARPAPPHQISKLKFLLEFSKGIEVHGDCELICRQSFLSFFELAACWMAGRND